MSFDERISFPLAVYPAEELLDHASQHKEMINVGQDRNANYTDLIITHCMHMSNDHSSPSIFRNVTYQLK